MDITQSRFCLFDLNLYVPSTIFQSIGHINPSLVLVQLRKTCPYITERFLMGHKESNKTNKQKQGRHDIRTHTHTIKPKYALYNDHVHFFLIGFFFFFFFFLLNSLAASGYFCHLLITFANSLDADQAQQKCPPDLDPSCLTLMVFLKYFFF